MTPTQYLSALLVALASFQSSSAIPTSNAYSEVIPGEGMPSLAELGLTSEQLYTMPVEANAEKILTRAAAKCGPVEAAYTDVNDVVACYNYLKNLGTRDCAVGRNYARSVFVHAGRARVIGQGSTAKATSSYCRDVATAVLYTINTCTRPDQSVAGFQAAGGNGDLTVGAVNLNYPK